jgi:shikimate kinase
MSIARLVELHSWDHFRDLEEEVVEDFAGRHRQVLDSGGGVVTRPINVLRLRESGILFLLEATVEDIVTRIGAESHRPSLTGVKSFTEEVGEVLKVREPLYRDAADYVIDTSSRDPEEAVDCIASTYRRRVHTA